MKKSIYVLLLMVCSNTLLFTQTPNPAPKEVQSYPQLQEWWRADNKKYGQDGATWLDNFYHGKGALVISTSTGAKTWLLEYPGDTNNVFSWRGCCGDGEIKTLDLNGEGSLNRIWITNDSIHCQAQIPDNGNTKFIDSISYQKNTLDSMLLIADLNSVWNLSFPKKMYSDFYIQFYTLNSSANGTQQDSLVKELCWKSEEKNQLEDLKPMITKIGELYIKIMEN